LPTGRLKWQNLKKRFEILAGLKYFSPHLSVESDGTKISAALISTIQEKDALAALLESMQKAWLNERAKN